VIKNANWVIIGAQTKPYRPPRIEWVAEIVKACDKAGIPVFLKDNLEPLLQEACRNEYKFNAVFLNGWGELRQELPNDKRN